MATGDSVGSGTCCKRLAKIWRLENHCRLDNQAGKRDWRGSSSPLRGSSLDLGF